MRTTKAFEQDLKDFFDMMLNDDPQFQDETRKHIETAAKSGLDRVLIDVSAYDAETGGTMTYQEPFGFNAFTSPITGEVTLAAENEPVIELVSVEEFDKFREDYGALIVEDGVQYGCENEKPAPDVHWICLLNEEDKFPKYDALCVIDGVIYSASHPTIEHAIDYAAGYNDQLRQDAWLEVLNVKGIEIPENIDVRQVVDKVDSVYGKLHYECCFKGAELDLQEVVDWACKTLAGEKTEFFRYLAHYPEEKAAAKPGMESLMSSAVAGVEQGDIEISRDDLENDR